MGQHKAGLVTDVSENTVSTLRLAEIRQDGGTQGRLCINNSVLRQYAALMKDLVEFPPVRVWFDGSSYWLTDGFHRVAAAESAGLTSVSAHIFRGTLSDALWDSCNANAQHGIRRSRADLAAIVERALAHPKARLMSNVEIAKHLGLPVTTIRRWRERVSSPSGQDEVRVVQRRNSTYTLRTSGIGARSRHATFNKLKPLSQLQREFGEIRSGGSFRVAQIIRIIEDWVLAGGTECCLKALETLVDSALLSRSGE
jgi:hypothetical protein